MKQVPTEEARRVMAAGLDAKTLDAPVVNRFFDWLAACGFYLERAKQPGGRYMTVIDDIVAERTRQIAKGYDAAHDDLHTTGEIAKAAASFAANDSRLYPWGRLPIHEGGRRETLIKAAAMLVAEIERFDRSR